MTTEFQRLAWRTSQSFKKAINAVASRLAVWLLKIIRLADAEKMSNVGGWLMRKIGPRLREHEFGRANLIAAFPEKSPAEIERILMGAWDNLGRTSAEFAHLDKLRFYDPANPAPSDVFAEPESYEHAARIRTDGKPALIFAAHLANWEIPAISAVKFNFDATILFRRPNLAGVAEAVSEIRGASMAPLIPSGPTAPFVITAALEQGKHVGMLVDQHYERGVEVMFFGRRCKANPMLARLARHFECPIHGTRVVRTGPRRFRVDLTDEIKPPRDADGKISIEGTMQMITSMIEDWVREHPEQWLWQHRRWR
ncbi:MAG TPA: lipid A biosynthesis lauroyl acyltransferase [Xanthobacteraceae bacterium]|jgi:KDO2-lipid IV(A) lauroyltransferase|nr:lipid A biosynthesis lauroyl acyltransferase [Xanthobacteraceae bacterium]